MTEENLEDNPSDNENQELDPRLSKEEILRLMMDVKISTGTISTSIPPGQGSQPDRPAQKLVVPQLEEIADKDQKAVTNFYQKGGLTGILITVGVAAVLYISNLFWPWYSQKPQIVDQGKRPAIVQTIASPASSPSSLEKRITSTILSSPVSEYDSQYSNAMELYKKGDYKNAAEGFQKVLELDPAKNAAEIHFKLGECYFNTENRGWDALEEFDKVKKIDPAYESLNKMTSAGIIRVAKEEGLEVKSYNSSFVYAVEGYPPRTKSIEAHRITLLNLSGEEYVSFEDALQKAAELDPTNGEAHYLLGIKYTRYGYGNFSLEECIEHLKKAMDLGYPVPPEEIRCHLGRLKFSGKDYTGALKEFFTVKKINPQFENIDGLIADVYIKLGCSFSEKDQNTDAIKYLKEALKYSPDNKSAKDHILTNLIKVGDNYANTKMYYSAIRKYEEAQKYGASTSDKITNCHYLQGLEYSNSGKYEEAIKEFKIVLKESPNFKAAENAMFETIRKKERK